MKDRIVVNELLDMRFFQTLKIELLHCIFITFYANIGNIVFYNLRPFFKFKNHVPDSRNLETKKLFSMLARNWEGRIIYKSIVTKSKL